MLFFLSLFACLESKEDTGSDTASDTGASPSSDEFAGLDFVLQSAEGYTPVSQAIRISFGESNEFSFGGDCNSMSGEYSMDGDVFGLSSVYGTEIGCDTALMDEDSWLVSFFTSSPSLEFDGEVMTFTGADATLIFGDTEIVIPDQALTGNVWIVDTYFSGEVASAYNIEEQPTISFSDDGSVSVFGGCNGGGGNYSVDGSTISFSDMISTEMACSSEIMEVENHVFQTLYGDVAFEIDENRLTLQGSELGISAYAE